MPTIYNQASLTYNGTTITSNTTTGELQATLSMEKSALVDQYTAGQNLTYVVSLVNIGTTGFQNLTLTDQMGAYTFNSNTLVPLTYVQGSIQYYVNGVQQTPAPSVTAGPPLVITGITVPANGNAVVAYEAQINQYAPLDIGDTVVNQVTATGTSLGTPLTAEKTVTAAVDPTLTISKSMNPTIVAENSQLTYTFIIENSGNSEADSSYGVSVRDTFNPILNTLTATLDGRTLVVGTDYTYNSGAFETIPGVITVPPATYQQNPDTGEWTTVPGTTVLILTGTV